MNHEPDSRKKIERLIAEGVEIPAPSTVYIDREVDTGLISGNGVTIYPGCRIYGSGTVISGGSKIGREGPATLENCLLGRSVELKAGYFKNAVFLEKAGMGYGAHVREGCILEEQAGGAHCVGLKQTVLFPFVTIGSLVNFCDCLMAGGTSRRNHSEVGSSYVHFNFTPDGDKTTPSLIGDVPRGVMLNQPPIFLGGQGGIVGPVRLGFGNIVAAGTILRNDILDDNKLIVGKTHKCLISDATPGAYRRLGRMVENNVIYISNLLALEQWYRHVRRGFLAREEFGPQIYDGALRNLETAIEERLKRLEAMAAGASASRGAGNPAGTSSARAELGAKIAEVLDILRPNGGSRCAVQKRNRFLEKLRATGAPKMDNYIEAIQSLPESVSAAGTGWLGTTVNELCLEVRKVLPALEVFDNLA